MEYKIHGTTMQTLDVRLANGEAVYTESGGMAWMSGDIEMSTGTRGGAVEGPGPQAGRGVSVHDYLYLPGGIRPGHVHPRGSGQSLAFHPAGRPKPHLPEGLFYVR